MPGQAEYQVGPCVGIDAGDQAVMSRYILNRVCEDFQVCGRIDFPQTHHFRRLEWCQHAQQFQYQEDERSRWTGNHQGGDLQIGCKT